MFGNVDDLHDLTRCRGLFGGTLVALAAHLVRIPPVVTDKLEALVRDVLGDGGDEVAWRENLEVALYLRVELGAVDDQAIGVGLVRGADLHLLHGEGVADDVLGQAAQVLEQVAVEADVRAEHLGDAKCEMAVRNGEEDRLGQQRAEELDLLLVAGGAEPAPLARERQQVLVLAVIAAHAGKAAFEVTAVEELVDHLRDDGAQEAVPGLVALLVQLQEPIEMP